MDIRYFDIHSHLNLSPLKEKKDEVLEKMKEHGVATITVGTSLETSKDAVVLAHQYEHLFATVGVHPTDHEEEFNHDDFLQLAQDVRTVALGETGLDYFRLGNKGETDEEILAIKQLQKALFKKHILLAEQVGKPLMIHARPSKGSMDAYHEVLDMLEETNIKANFHFFVGDMDVVTRIKSQGHTISFDGPITFADDYNEVIASTPIDMIMAETDAPFASPEPYRGKMCEPWMVIPVVQAIARIKGMNEEIVRKALVENAIRFFGINV